MGGASREQVQAAIAEKGYTLLEQGAKPAYEKYRGTFAGHPAELRFFYERSL